MERSNAESAYKLAYDEGVRALSQQQTVIDSFRTRAGLLLSAAAITTSFLGAQALAAGDPNLATWTALASFFFLGVACLAILWPREWEFTADPRDVIATYIEAEDPLPLDAIHRDLALHMEDSTPITALAWSSSRSTSGSRALCSPWRSFSGSLTS